MRGCTGLFFATGKPAGVTMFGSRSYKGSSTFLKTANVPSSAPPTGLGAASSATPAGVSGFDEGDVLAAVAKPEVSTIESLADALQTTPAAIDPVVTKLSEDGFLNVRSGYGAPLTLSDIGERALRYTGMAKP